MKKKHKKSHSTSGTVSRGNNYDYDDHGYRSPVRVYESEEEDHCGSLSPFHYEIHEDDEGFRGCRCFYKENDWD